MANHHARLFIFLFTLFSRWFVQPEVTDKQKDLAEESTGPKVDTLLGSSQFLAGEATGQSSCHKCLAPFREVFIHCDRCFQLWSSAAASGCCSRSVSYCCSLTAWGRKTKGATRWTIKRNRSRRRINTRKDRSITRERNVGTSADPHHKKSPNVNSIEICRNASNAKIKTIFSGQLFFDAPNVVVT